MPIIEHDIADFSVIPGLDNPSPQLLEEWLIYVQYKEGTLLNTPALSAFWENVTTCDRFLLLSVVASEAIWMPGASVDVGRSFSQYKHLLNDRRESLTEENTKRLVMLYHNGDIEGRFNN